MPVCASCCPCVGIRSADLRRQRHYDSPFARLMRLGFAGQPGCRLQMYPFSELKIDQPFTRSALTDGFARASVEMSVRLAREMGLKIVAEGVETIEMWNFLADLGIDEAQGYLMAKPMAPTDFMKLLERGVPAVPVARRA